MVDTEFELTVTVRIPAFGDPARERSRLTAAVERAVKLMVSPKAVVDGAVATGRRITGTIPLLDESGTQVGTVTGVHVEERPGGTVVTAVGELDADFPVDVIGGSFSLDLPDPEFGWTHLCEESPDSPGWCAYHRSYCTAAGPGPHVTDHPE